MASIKIVLRTNMKKRMAQFLWQLELAKIIRQTINGLVNMFWKRIGTKLPAKLKEPIQITKS